MIRKAAITDIERVLEIARSCAQNMIAEGIFQWNISYPVLHHFTTDLQHNQLWVLVEKDVVLGCISISTIEDEEYRGVQWLTFSGTHYYIHRLAVDPLFQGQGFARQLMDFAEQKAKDMGITSIRLDTFSKNARNNRFYQNRGYLKLQDIYLPSQSTHPFHCYELVL